MGRSVNGLVISLFLVAGCASVEPGNPTRDGGGTGGGGTAGDDLSSVADLSPALSPDLSPSVPVDMTGSAGGGGTAGGGGGGGGSAGGGGTTPTCTPNVACSTGNPGACNSGHIVCSNNVGSCVPDVETQSCYTGPAGTSGVGACTAGVQTCIGTLGTCSGSVTPAPQENCFNQVDDDCNGVINNGCPDHVITGTPVQLTTRGNGSSGTAFTAICPANTFVGKVVPYGDQTDSGYISGVDVYCLTPTLVANASSMTYSLTEALDTSPTVSADASIIDTDFKSIACASGNGIGWGTNGGYQSAGLDSLGMYCTNLTGSLSSTNQLTFVYSADTSTTPWGWSGSTVTSFTDTCGAGSVLVGYQGKKNRWFTSFSAVCAPLTVVYK